MGGGDGEKEAMVGKIEKMKAYFFFITGSTPEQVQQGRMERRDH